MLMARSKTVETSTFQAFVGSQKPMFLSLARRVSSRVGRQMATFRAVSAAKSRWF